MRPMVLVSQTVVTPVVLNLAQLGRSSDNYVCRASFTETTDNLGSESQFWQFRS